MLYFFFHGVSGAQAGGSCTIQKFRVLYHVEYEL